MGKVWIENLAQKIKEQGREAAENYGRDQHRAGIIEAEGKIFFLALVLSLEEDMGEIRNQLQGSAVSCETSVAKEGPSLVRLRRSRFPWFDATLKHDDAAIMLEYTRGFGPAGEPALLSNGDRKLVHFALDVDSQDKLSVAEAFADNPRRFDRPDLLAKYILELLFTIQPSG